MKRRPSQTLLNIDLAYETNLGQAVIGQSETLLRSDLGKRLKGQVQLVFTSPPFPLNRKKKYGNKQNEEFKIWLKAYAPLLKNLLTPNGSIVIEMGNAWEPGLPVMSTLAMEALLDFKAAGDLFLCQEFIWYNPAKLPTPAQWVTVTRARVKDAFTRLWWLSSTPHPKADNRNVLVPYSSSMKALLKTKKYNAGTRPSEHVISETSFLKDNGGAISPNVLFTESEPESLVIGANTHSSDLYHKYCKLKGYEPHPARMPIGLAKFFISLCTDPGDIVLDPFGGSNTTGAAAEELRRKWIAIEVSPDYAKSGRGRFQDLWEKDAQKECQRRAEK